MSDTNTTKELTVDIVIGGLGKAGESLLTTEKNAYEAAQNVGFSNSANGKESKKTLKNIFLFLIIIFNYGLAHAQSGVFIGNLNNNPVQIRDVRLVCDYKKDAINFYTFKDNIFVKRDDIGFLKMTPVLDKFIGIKILNEKDATYVYGYSLSIHEVTGEISPDLIGMAYVNRFDLYCLDVQQLF
jgi:CRISPR/Cas system-associated endoribonuclease Cas2